MILIHSKRVLDEYFDFTKNNSKDFQELQEGDIHSVILTTKVADEINKDVGDTVKIKIDSQEAELKVVGIYDGKAYDNGLSVLMNKKLLIDEFKIRKPI